jgi:hypothetical protein
MEAGTVYENIRAISADFATERRDRQPRRALAGPAGNNRAAPTGGPIRRRLGQGERWGRDGVAVTFQTCYSIDGTLPAESTVSLGGVT